jgi:hypothetical protein
MQTKQVKNTPCTLITIHIEHCRTGGRLLRLALKLTKEEYRLKLTKKEYRTTGIYIYIKVDDYLRLALQGLCIHPLTHALQNPSKVP